MHRVRHPNRRQIPGAQQASQCHGIGPVGLDPLARSLWHQRGRNHDAVVTQSAHLAVKTIPRRARFIAEGWRAVLEPVIARYRGTAKRLYFRGDAAFANPEIYEFLEAKGMGYAIRLAANRVLQDRIGHLLKRPVGRPPQEVRRYYSSFSYRAGSWSKPRRVVAKVEWHPVV